MIEDYEEKWRSGLLFSHLDDTARQKFIGYETNYDEAMNRLNQFYGDPSKIVTCVMREVTAPRIIMEGDYEGLLSYSVILESNYNRLKNINSEHEISNTGCMISILKKFPRCVAEKWNEELTLKTATEKSKPFPVFVEWLKSRKETWERMSACDPGKKGGAAGGKMSFFGDATKQGRVCFSCGEEGHIRVNCPQSRRSPKDEKPKTRRNPKIKNFGVLSIREIKIRSAFQIVV